MTMANRTILYTGAAGGLGLPSTLAFLAAGATVVAVDHDPAKVAALRAAADAAGHGKLVVAALEMSDLGAFRASLEALSAEVGGFDIVINNAAIYPSKPFEDYTIEEHQAVQRVNVDAGIVCVQVALPSMRAKGFGRIINVASVTLSGGWANLSPYIQSKGALVGLTRAWAREFGAYGVTVNAISPGAFPTDAEKIHPDPEGYNRHVLERQAVKRRGDPSDIANALLFLCSDGAGFITGQTLNIDGGWWMT
ncbi:oxidoreductase [Kaistia algarum]|uniref:SDR family NAD(P)-dependent oxidoreductase n=1 Tax=Kaistia algarum TaxID=2083279 RepID=UPI000CE72227|nr:SDR family oxidoreductase [Kaistia algarum]MCX5512687.1 SDR family oxidoreductase [Kaistia algarum]PPE81803.1 oxidoreductase [Kaistia algarum]